MSLLSPEERAAIIGAAMQRKFGNLLKWVRPPLLHTFGPNDLNIVDKFEATLHETKDAVSKTLANWPDETIRAIGVELQGNRGIDGSLFQTLATAALDGILRNEPPPSAYGFGHPKFQADFSYWEKCLS